MNETRDLLERVGERFAFPEAAFERLERRRDRNQRNRRIRAGVTGIVILAALLFGLARATFTGSDTRPGITPTPSVVAPEPEPTPSVQPSEPRSWPPSDRIPLDEAPGTYFVDVRTGAVTPLPASITDVAFDDVTFDWGMALYQGSPDGSTVLFVGRDGSGLTQICLADADGAQVRSLTADPIGALWPAWSPDGSKIVYLAGAGDGSDMSLPAELTVMDITTGETMALAAGRAGEFQYPRFSANGETILFTTFERELWAIPSAGGERTPFLSNAFDASYSPDGTTIAFERWREACLAACHGGMSEPQIWFADIAGGGAIVVGGVATSDARWAPDGARIAFSRAVRSNDETFKGEPVGSTGPGSDRENGGVVILEVATSQVTSITGPVFPIGWLDAHTLIVQVTR